MDLTLTLLAGAGRIDGTVLREGKGVSQAMVVLVPQSLQGNADLFRRDQSDSDGTFSLYQVVPGRYTVVAIENGWNLDWQNPDVLRPYLEHGESVEVTGSGTLQDFSDCAGEQWSIHHHRATSPELRLALSTRGGELPSLSGKEKLLQR